MTDTAWLVDKSALTRLHRSADRDAWSARIERGLVRIGTVTLLEVGYSARSSEDMHSLLHRPPIDTMPVEYLTPAAEHRAVGMLELLARRGQHRAPSVPDLLTAAIAEMSGLVVLHVDKDFELIAEVSGQRLERLQLSQ